MIKPLLSVLTITSIMISCKPASEPATSEKLTYPITAKSDQVDDYFGVKVSDPYRWLENDTAEDVKKWVTEENKVTFGYLEKIPFRNKIKERLTDIFNYPKYSNPFRAGEYYFFSKNDGLQNQSVIYYQKGLDGKPEVFLDPNTMSSDGTAAVSLLGFSKDKKYVAYAINQSGSDWQTIYVMEVATKKLMSDKLEWVKFSGASWKNNGFYYARYDAPPKGKEFSQKNEYHKIYYHRLGDTQDKDVLVYENKDKPLRYYGASVTEDERFLIIYVSEGTDGTEMYYKDLQSNQKDFGLLFAGFQDNYSVINNIGDKLLVQTDAGAPNQRVILVDPKNPKKENWKDVIPEKPELLESAATGGGKLFVSYLKDVTTHVYQYSLEGNLEHEIALPALGTAFGFSGDKEDALIFYTFTSFTYPPTIYKYDIASGKSDIWQKSDVKFNPEEYETKQVFYNSKDGTKVPMFLVYKKGIKLDGNNPTLLYGYGGFNISLTPSFSTSRLILLENGGIFVMANIRGGGEYGEKWHNEGKLLKKQNVFDDFIAAAEYLIKEKYTSSSKLAIQGGSNGGLLVGACMLQRPDLYRVAFPAVGVMDMLRYHKFTVGWGWAVEYGSSDSLENFKNLYAYSPLHNIKEGVEYPATMVTTADHDDRVVPAHSFKFIATLQERYKGNRPQVIRIDVKAGHGAGKPTSKIIEEQADIWSFMFYNMGITPIYK
ncbi:MAG: S9 family peptidase [Bacteroidetes bacterium]|nr:S9 family peptidase [Bacteroidota bacterium]MBX7239352.1 prolyl oligopeptidase family serine peptidase [Bacteroidia bacterium]HMU77837.1 prolyl oligopeptidase family serine peptidase [Bacteroidia bacterium]HMW09716.1 prolyl oligopeptidase family serine peptidase [Bacteroidia bacterium]HMX96968.1 prolyl oligopeptidase family serine peptidase [Bacteroidia bacterium]